MLGSNVGYGRLSSTRNLKFSGKQERHELNFSKMGMALNHQFLICLPTNAYVTGAIVVMFILISVTMHNFKFQLHSYIA